jgi:predicted transcriptional regulator
MASVTVRIEEKSHKALRELAERSGESMQAILTHAIEAYRRERFLESANAAFEALRKDQNAWRREQEERAEWDATLRDTQEKE